MALRLATHLALSGDDLWQVFAETHRPRLTVADARQLLGVVRANPGGYQMEGRTIDGWEHYRGWLEVLPADAAPETPARKVQPW